MTGTAAETDPLVEELMIRAAAAAPHRLHRFEALMEEFVFALGPVLTGFIAAPVEVTLEEITYPDTTEALAMAGDTGVSLAADVDPWQAPLNLWIERPVLTGLLAALVGATPEDGDRAFSRLEQGIVRRIGQTVLDRFAGALAPVRMLSPHVTALEAPEWDEGTGTIAVRLKLTHGETAGTLLLIIPFAAFVADREALSQQLALPAVHQGGEARAEMASNLTRAGIGLTAVLGEGRVPLGAALAWKPGDLIDFNIDPGAPLEVACGEQILFRAVAGRRETGAVALRITSEVELERFAPDGPDH